MSRSQGDFQESTHRPVTVALLSAEDVQSKLANLVVLLKDSVDAGASLGFLPPLMHADARDYWLSLCSELKAGSRLLIAAHSWGRMVGTGQLTFPAWSNGQHRAELQKLFVDSALRSQGVGRLLMTALHDAARRRGRSLIVLNTRHGESPVRFYKSLGYRVAGTIPGYTRGAAGERYDNLTLYQEFA